MCGRKWYPGLQQQCSAKGFGLQPTPAYVLSLALQAAKFPADVSAVTEKTIGTVWSDKVAVSEYLCF